VFLLAFSPSPLELLLLPPIRYTTFYTLYM
jgi:hypothetical protein